ncbi:CopG family transcriptional regulator [Candidatus Bathyarchaeota archaeon]|nr:MAG: CopG family transcriptional regulator [Candidatus Bathyarchaeota archaeon]
MSSVISVKVRREIKEEMLKYSGKVNWAEEIRRFIEERLRQVKAEENIRKVVEELSKIPFEAPKGSSVDSVRGDRDSR